jgi:fermentation-respiration switch protein FrsA (DUF1100 family)
MLYHPPAFHRTPAEAGMANVVEIQLTTEDGIRIAAWHSPAPSGAPTIVYFHGNGGSVGMFTGLMRRIQKAGYGAVFVSYRGYPGSEGFPSEEGLYADGRAVMSWMTAQGIAPEQIFLFGHSLGTGVAVKLASERQVGGIILESPYTSIVDVAALSFPVFPLSWLMKDQYDSLSRIKDVHAPLLLMHGALDKAIPMRFGQQLFEAANEPKVAYFAPEGNHNDLWLHGSIDQVIAFVEAHKSQALARQAD